MGLTLNYTKTEINRCTTGVMEIYMEYKLYTFMKVRQIKALMLMELSTDKDLELIKTVKSQSG